MLCTFTLGAVFAMLCSILWFFVAASLSWLCCFAAVGSRTFSNRTTVCRARVCVCIVTAAIVWCERNAVEEELFADAPSLGAYNVASVGH